MTGPIASFSGINSGIQWRDIVDQIMNIEAGRRFTPVANRQGELRSASEAWKRFQDLSTKVRDTARAMQLATAFDTFKTSLTKPPSGRELVSVTAGTGAAPGSYDIEVLATAQPEKLGGAIATTATTALGVTGSFALNGRAITVVATDTLNSLRDKINAASSGAGTDGVSATVLSASGGMRLVLTAASTGSAGIETTDDGNGTLTALGFTDGSTNTNIGTDGAARTQRMSSSTAAIASGLGIPLPTPSTIRIGGQSVAVDLAVDSLTTIANKIAIATGNVDAARVKSEKVGATTRYWLETDAPVEVDTADAANSARTLSVLGFTKAGRSDVAQVVASANQFGDTTTGNPATMMTLISDLSVNGQSLGLASGDVFTIAGTRGDGTSVSRSIQITSTTSLGDIVAAINENTTGFGAGTRTATGGVTAGRITLSDSVAGESSLGITLSVQRATGSTISLGAFGTANGTLGRNRVITAGADAVVRVDGQLARRSTNIISDVIAGTTFTALGAEIGATTTVSITRDADAAAKLLQDFATAYNAARSYATTATASGGPLAGNGALRSMALSLTTQLLQPVVGLSGTFTSAALAGLEHDRNGVLSLKLPTFKAAFAADPVGIQRLFTQNGTTTDSELSFVTAGDKSVPTATGYAVAITQVATRATVAGASFATYATTGAADTMAVTDVTTGRTASITMANGDSIATIVQRLNSSFAVDGLQLTAERTVDDRIQIVSAEFGTEGGFSVAYTPGAGGDGTAALGIAAGAYAGLDVAGTINGAVATGLGQILTGGAGDASDGIALRYTGAAARAAGVVTLALGVGGTLSRAANALAADNTGAALQVTASSEQADALDRRLDDIQKRLDARRDALVRQFIAMESALAKSQALGNALLSQLNALNSQNQR
jgi:flagellar hook-associated protein 2